MEILPPNSTCLELSIAMPGFSSSSSSFPSSGAKAKAKLAKSKVKGGAAAIKVVDINEEPSSRSEEECMDEEEILKSGGGGPSQGPGPRKKLRLTKEQSRCLEQSFLQNQALNPKEKDVLAMELRLKPRQVEVWFQNRRARSKMKETEKECEYLKRWVGALREQNRKLHKELSFIKSQPPAPHLSTTISCPRCHRLTASADPSSSLVSVNFVTSYIT